LVQVDINDVYQDPAVSKLRNELMTKYAQSMTETDQMPAWADRETARKKASQTLAEGIPLLQDMADHATSPQIKQEASLAIMEIQYALDDYKALALARETVPALMTTEQLRLQADCYRGESTRNPPDPKGAEELYGVTTPRGCLRHAIVDYKFAQLLDDLARQNPKRDKSERARASMLCLQRSMQIIQANQLLDKYAPSTPRDKTGATFPALPADTGILSGAVVDSDGVTAVPEALVMFWGASRKIEASALTDKDGRFANVDLDPGSYTATVFKNRQTTAVKTFVMTDDNLSLTIQYPSASIHGVVKSSSGEPIENDKVMVILASGFVNYLLTTDKNGAYRVESIVPGKYLIGVLVNDQNAWAEKNVEITDQRDQTKNLQQPNLPSK